MLKNHYVITLSDAKGTSTLNLNTIIKKSIIIIAIVIITGLGISAWTIASLYNKLDALHKQEEKLLKQNDIYSSKLQEKINELEALGSSIDDIEELIGLGGSVDNNLTIMQRAEMVKASSAEKSYMLEVIPSGSPIKYTKISSKFGFRIHPIKNVRRFHKGIDLKAQRKTPVYATADGVVTYVGGSIYVGYGRMIVISHAYGMTTTYAHLNKILVKRGDIVFKGNKIALSGNTGISTGPHLHYEVRYANKVLNPINFIEWDIKNYDTLFNKERRVPWEYLIKLINKQAQKIAQQ